MTKFRPLANFVYTRTLQNADVLLAVAASGGTQ